MLVWVQGIMKSPPNPICPGCSKNIAGRHIAGGEACYMLLNFSPRIEYETDKSRSEEPSVEVVKILCHNCFRQGKETVAETVEGGEMICKRCGNGCPQRPEGYCFHCLVAVEIDKATGGKITAIAEAFSHVTRRGKCL